MTTVTAEQIAGLATALRAAWRSGDKSWLDLAAIALNARADEIVALQERVEGLEGERDALKLQAQSWAMEARGHKSSLHEAYQALTGATGEPGNWNGPKPIIDALQAAEARADALSAELEGLKKGSSSSRGALPSAVCPGGPDRPRPAGWRDMESAPQNGTRVLVDFSGAGPIVAFRDRDFPAMWVRYVGYGKSSRFPLVHEDYARGWMPLPSSEVQFISPNVVSAGNPATDTINTSQNHPSTNGEG